MQKLLKISIFFLLFSACTGQANSGEYLFKKYFEVFPIQISEETNRTEPLLRPAYEAYSTQDYTTVLKITSDFTRNVAELPVVMMAQSMGYIFADSLEQADHTLAVLEAHPIIGDNATWYRALLKVKEEDFKAAINYLDQVPRLGDSELTSKAAALKSELEQN
ncbi:MAG: hypothetical protein AB8F78_12940 [Saprospiraceae bacterium]